MLTRHMILSCDHPGCDQRVIGPAFMWNGSGADVDQLLTTAKSSGWTRVGSHSFVRHYCPTHRLGSTPSVRNPSAHPS